MYAPVYDFAALMAVGPRVAEHTITTIAMSPTATVTKMLMRRTRMKTGTTLTARCRKSTR